MAKALTYYKERLLALRNACNALLAEMEGEIAVSDRPKRKSRNDFAEYEQALISGKRLRKPKELRRS